MDALLYLPFQVSLSSNQSYTVQNTEATTGISKTWSQSNRKSSKRVSINQETGRNAFSVCHDRFDLAQQSKFVCLHSALDGASNGHALETSLTRAGAV
jgi:hypothetical protein